MSDVLEGAYANQMRMQKVSKKEKKALPRDPVVMEIQDCIARAKLLSSTEVSRLLK